MRLCRCAGHALITDLARVHEVLFKKWLHLLVSHGTVLISCSPLSRMARSRCRKWSDTRSGKVVTQRYLLHPNGVRKFGWSIILGIFVNLEQTRQKHGAVGVLDWHETRILNAAPFIDGWNEGFRLNLRLLHGPKRPWVFGCTFHRDVFSIHPTGKLALLQGAVFGVKGVFSKTWGLPRTKGDFFGYCLATWRRHLIYLLRIQWHCVGSCSIYFHY